MVVVFNCRTFILLSYSFKDLYDVKNIELITCYKGILAKNLKKQDILGHVMFNYVLLKFASDTSQ